jgi:hypothetical protein
MSPTLEEKALLGRSDASAWHGVAPHPAGALQSAVCRIGQDAIWRDRVGMGHEGR